MPVLLIVLAVFALGVIALTAGVIAFDVPQPPKPMASVDDAFDHVDFRDLPAPSYYLARDGKHLKYRAYPGDPNNIVVLIHGSSGTSASMHVLARGIRAHGATVYALAMRGHDGMQRSGDIDYVGQLDDDVADFMQTLPARHAGERRTLVGFSSGGGFVLRFAAGEYGSQFDRFVLISPQMPARSPLVRPNSGGWVSVAVPRVIALSMLSRIGFHAFDALPVIAFAVAPEKQDGHTAVYSFRMLRNFGPNDDYLHDFRRVRAQILLIAGGADELFYSHRYAQVLKPVRPDLAVTLVPGMRHMDMIVDPRAVKAVANKVCSN